MHPPIEIPRIESFFDPVLDFNQKAGHMPPAEDDGKVYFKIPINVLSG